MVESLASNQVVRVRVSLSAHGIGVDASTPAFRTYKYERLQCSKPEMCRSPKGNTEFKNRS